MKRLNPDLMIALSSLGILMAAFFSGVSNGGVQLAGIPIPPVCAFKLLTSLDCPGCGLTRALVFAIHGRFLDSYFMHLWGIPLLFILILQVPYRLIRTLRPEWRPLRVPEPIKKWISPAIFLSVLLPWGVKTVTYLVIRYL